MADLLAKKGTEQRLIGLAPTYDIAYQAAKREVK